MENTESPPQQPASTPPAPPADASAPAVTATAEAAAPVRSFDAMNLDPAVKQALDEMGYEAPMEVQTAVYDHVMKGIDLMVQSRTGSGKTAAFGIPIAQLLQPGSSGVQSLILAPTRELALQVSQELTRICAYRNLQVVPVYGGAPMGRQIDALKAGAQIVAGTPGRVLDHIRRGTFNTDNVRLLVLDECDEMLSMGFQEEIEKIIKELPGTDKRQTLLFSATIPDEIERIGKRHMRTYDKISLSDGYIGVQQIEHQYYLVSGLGRTRDLLRVIEFEQPDSAIIFCNTREDTAMVAQFLQRAGLDAEAISSDLTQADRERVMGRMREKNLRFLCATDIAARGIDISDLSHVINYTFPESPEVYVHRTGRTGRAGKDGTAISLIGPREIGSFYYLKLLYKIRPEEKEFPSERELKTRREAERWAKIVEEVPEQPGEEWLSLAKRVMQSGEGERLVAAVLKRIVEGAPRIVRDRAAEAAAQAEADRRSSPARRPEAREGKAEPPVERDIVREAQEDRARRAERAERTGGRDRDRGPRRDGRGGPPERGGRGDRPDRGGSRDRGGERRDARPERGAPSDRPPRGDRPERSERSDRPPREARPAQPERQALTPAPEPPPGGESREFWEAWVDEKSKAEPVGAEGTAPVISTDPAALPAEGEIAPPAPRPRRERERRAEDPAGTVRLYLNVGKREGLDTDQVTRIISESSPEVAAALVRVTLRDTHSYAAIKEEQADAAIEALRGKKVGERELVVERAKTR